MGAWSTAINGNDEYKSVYESFRELYSEFENGKWLYDIASIRKKIKEEFAFQLADKDLEHEIWFAQAKAFWDYGINDDLAYKKTKQIISSGANLDVWRRLNAS